MLSQKPDRPYFEAWLKRAGRQLSASGRLSQIAIVLADEDGGSHSEWRGDLQKMLQGEYIPSIDVITRIDHLLAKPARSHHDSPHQTLLF